MIDGGTVSEFEDRLSALDQRLEEAQKIGKAVVSAIGRARAAVKVGRINDIEKALSAISQQIGDAQEATARLGSAWDFDAAAYLADGRFIADLKAAADGLGLKLFEREGRVYCFPLLVRVDAKDAAVKIGKATERAIRPSELARRLAALQKRPQRFREEQFLDLLYRTWRRLAGNQSDGPAAPVLGLADIHDTLTLLPGADYPAQEFARDLLLLDRKPDLRTKDGSRFEFPASTVSKGGMKRLVVYDEEGRERTYIGIRFVTERRP